MGSSAASRAACAKATAIALGSEHTCALTRAGGARCWGSNYYGELGDGTTRRRTVPVSVSGFASGVTAIAAGSFHACALTKSGGVKCWGSNEYGQLGNGTTTESHRPTGVVGLGRGVTAISTESDHTCALTRAGGVECWGDDEFGQLGDGTTSEGWPYPVGVSGLPSGVTAIAAGGVHTCALTSAGGVKCWGWGGDGELGDGTCCMHTTPVSVSGLASGVTAIAVGWEHTCALTSAGGAKCWGENKDGELGDGTRVGRLTPVDVSGLASGVTAITAGNGHTCALTSVGGVKCWGYNHDGRLGDGTRTSRLTPVDVSGLASGVTAIAAGDFNTCAITSSGGVKCWGDNEEGQLGDGTTIRSPRPIGVAGFGGSVHCGVPRVVGRALAKAMAMIARANCRVGEVVRVTSRKNEGTVVSQSPSPGRRLRRGSKVRLEVSRGR